jgi:hypothetical protein
MRYMYSPSQNENDTQFLENMPFSRMGTCCTNLKSQNNLFGHFETGYVIVSVSKEFLNYTSFSF